MKSHNPTATHANGLLKGVALFQLLLAAVRLVIERGTWPSISMMIMGALLMIFCAREKVNDERVEHLKFKAAKAGLLFGTLLAMLFQVAVLLAKPDQPRSGRGTPLPASMPLSAFDVLIVIMLITLGCYYYWRWQDGRTGETN